MQAPSGAVRPWRPSSRVAHARCHGSRMRRIRAFQRPGGGIFSPFGLVAGGSGGSPGATRQVNRLWVLNKKIEFYNTNIGDASMGDSATTGSYHWLALYYDQLFTFRSSFDASAQFSHRFGRPAISPAERGPPRWSSRRGDRDGRGRSFTDNVPASPAQSARGRRASTSSSRRHAVLPLARAG